MPDFPNPNLVVDFQKVSETVISLTQFPPILFIILELENRNTENRVEKKVNFVVQPIGQIEATWISTPPACPIC